MAKGAAARCHATDAEYQEVTLPPQTRCTLVLLQHAISSQMYRLARSLLCGK